MGGVPCFRGTRVPISTLFENLADGMPLGEILEQWPSLNRADVVAVLSLSQAPNPEWDCIMARTLADLIVADPEIMSGTPCFRGTRVPATTLFDNLASGMTITEILEEWPSLNRDDVQEVLRLVSASVARPANKAA